MARLPDKCVDMIFADPPYNLQLGGDLFRPEGGRVDAVDDDWDKFDSLAVYDEFTRDWLAEARRILKDDGTIWVIGSYHNIYRVGTLLQDAGFWILNDIVWRKTNPMPNFRGTRFTNAHETLLWCAKDEKARYTFNYRAMKALNDDLQMRSDWLLPICSGGERVKDDDGDKAHPTQKPEVAAVPDPARLHQARRRRARPVFRHRDDRRGGAAAGPALDRDRARARLCEGRPASGSIRPCRSTKARCRPWPTSAASRGSPSACWSKAALVPPGTLLTDAKRRWKAQVRADGSIACEAHAGSIHKVGAALQGAPSCNGWTFWHVEQGGELKPIDALQPAIGISPRYSAGQCARSFAQPLSSIARSAIDGQVERLAGGLTWFSAVEI